MYPTFGMYVLLDVEQAQTMAQDDEAGPLPLEDQFVRASIGRYLVLQSDADVPSVCLLPDAFESLSEVPTDASSCDCTERAGCWSSIAYLGLINAEPGEYTGAGFFLKANGGDLYRGRVIEAVASSEVSTLSIEYQRVME